MSLKDAFKIGRHSLNPAEMGIQVAQTMSESPPEQLIRCRLESSSHTFTLMSGRKPFSKTLSKEAISSSLLLSVLRTSKAPVGLLHRSSSTQELYSTDRKVQACIQRATSKKMKEGRNTQTCMFVKAPGVRLKKSSKYDVQVNFSRPLPICQVPWPI
jgi:hypothetical protein